MEIPGIPRLEADPLKEQFNADFAHLVTGPPLVIQVSPLVAWLLLANLQLALRHPDNQGATAELTKDFARTLEIRLAVTPTLAEVARRGWSTDFDGEAAPPIAAGPGGAS